MGRSPCCEKAHTNKGAWTRDEDQRLIDYIRRHGEGCWRSLPKNAGLSRCGKSCRLRWINYLRPDLKRGNFTAEEDEIIIKLHSLLGNKWSLIAGRLPGRTDNEIKNYWNTHIKRKLLSRGIDPQTHRPLHQTATAKKPDLKAAPAPHPPKASSPQNAVVSSSFDLNVGGLLEPSDVKRETCEGEEEGGDDHDQRVNLELSVGPSQPSHKAESKAGQRVTYLFGAAVW